MPLLIDTSVAVALREGDKVVMDRAERLGAIARLSVLSVIELEGGVPLAPEGARVRRILLDELYATLAILDFGLAQADVYREIVVALGYSRAKIIDRMIAATAISAGAALATLNARDFRNIPKLTVEDWSR